MQLCSCFFISIKLNVFRVIENETCNGAVYRGVPGGVVCIGRLVSEGVLVVCSRRYTAFPSVCTYYLSIWVYEQTLLLHPLFLSEFTVLLQVNLRAAASPKELSPYGSPAGYHQGFELFHTTELPGKSPRPKRYPSRTGSLIT